jgi:hypothetical protein
LLVDNKYIFTTFAIVTSKYKIEMKKELEVDKKDSYRFISDEEPTDEQLNQIMKEVAIDKFQKELQQLCVLKSKQQL